MIFFFAPRRGGKGQRTNPTMGDTKPTTTTTTRAVKVGDDEDDHGLPRSVVRTANRTHDRIVGNAHASHLSDALSSGMEEHLFGCCKPLSGCCLSCCCPCVVMAANEANVSQRPVTCVDYLCCCPNPYTTRQTLRQRFGLPWSPWTDCIALTCCGPCFLHQTTREVARRTRTAPEFYKMV